MPAERWPDIAGRIEGGAHILPVRIYYEDTDFSGLVYHASYLRFCERGRSDLLRLSGLSHRDLIGEGEGGVFFAVRRMEIDFLAPARIDDLLEVRSAFSGLGGARLEIAQSVRRESQEIMHAAVTVAILGADGRPRRISHALKGRLAPLICPPAAGS